MNHTEINDAIDRVLTKHRPELKHWSQAKRFDFESTLEASFYHCLEQADANTCDENTLDELFKIDLMNFEYDRERTI